MPLTAKVISLKPPASETELFIASMLHELCSPILDQVEGGLARSKGDFKSARTLFICSDIVNLVGDMPVDALADAGALLPAAHF